jgi:mannose-1-phosphate guanylyltransferase
MNRLQHTWAVVLAAGDGTRLSTLTTDSDGNPVPKQFCSLNGGASLLHEALQRANRIVPRERVCATWSHQLEAPADGGPTQVIDPAICLH